MKRYFSIILNALLFTVGIYGIYRTCYSEGFMQTDAFLYYTVQSNLLVMAIAIISIIFESRKLQGKSIPNVVYTIRYVGTVAITLTFLVFSVMLTPVLIAQGEGDYLRSIGNFIVHTFVPLCAILDWCFYGKSSHFKTLHILLTLLAPLYYLIFALVRSFLGLTISGNHVPYFFLDYKKLGWFNISEAGIGVAWWIVILIIALVGMAWGFKKIRNR